MRETSAQSPLFVKTYDFLLWLIPLTLKFPKAHRFLLAERLGEMALDFYESDPGGGHGTIRGNGETRSG